MRRLLFLGKNLHLVLGRNCSDSEFGCIMDDRENVAAVESYASGIRLVLGVGRVCVWSLNGYIKYDGARGDLLKDNAMLKTHGDVAELPAPLDPR